MQRVIDVEAAEAFADAEKAIDLLFASGVPVAGVDDAYAWIRGGDRLRRKVAALQVQVLAAIERSSLHQADGHASAKVMVRCGANLSGPEAFRLDQVARVLTVLPVVAEAFAQGLIGVGQVERLGRTYANRRVRKALIGLDEHLAVLAARLPYVEFEQKLAEWERLEDQDGPGEGGARAHRNRAARLDRGLDGAWDFVASLGGVQGAEIAEIFGHFIEAERLVDWAEARERLGDAVTAEDLCRTEPQRRADAFHAAMQAAASAIAGATGGSIIVTNIVMDLTTFEHHLRRVAGTDAGAEPDDRPSTDLAAEAAGLQPLDLEPLDPGPEDQPDRDDQPDRRDGGEQAPSGPAEPTPSAEPQTRATCRTLDGQPLDPAEVTAQALLGHVRRVVIGRDGVVLDMSRRSRLFAGLRQLAVRIPELTCAWPGCCVPVSRTQSDHIDAYNGPQRGRTDPGNGAPLCGMHNRFKHRSGIIPRRDEHGRWHAHRPDGTEIPYPGTG